MISCERGKCPSHCGKIIDDADAPTAKNTVGRGLFKFSREVVTDAESGGCTLFEPLVMDDLPQAEFPRNVAYEHCAS